MKTLLIVAPSMLSMASKEIQTVITALDTTPLLGDEATSHNLAQSLAETEYDLLWFIAHGNTDGIELADGLIDNATLTQIMRESRPACFINTCHSIGVAMDLHNEIDSNVICNIDPPQSETAIMNGAVLARNLGKGYSLTKAFDLSKPGRNSTMIHLNGPDTDMGDQGPTTVYVSKLPRTAAIPNWLVAGLIAFAILLSALDGSFMVLQTRSAWGAGPGGAILIGAGLTSTSSAIIGYCMFVVAHKA